MLALWKVAAVGATLVQVGGLRAEKEDSEVWGSGGAGCLEGVDKISGEESPGVHRGVMLRYAAALEEAMKEGNWPLLRSGQLEVPGSYPMLAPWKVAAVARRRWCK